MILTLLDLRGLLNEHHEHDHKEVTAHITGLAESDTYVITGVSVLGERVELDLIPREGVL